MKLPTTGAVEEAVVEEEDTEVGVEGEDIPSDKPRPVEVVVTGVKKG